MKKAVIFDMDGVIVDSEMIYHKRRSEFFQSKGIQLSEEMQQSFIGTNPNDMFLAIFPDDSQEREAVKKDFLAFRETYKINVTSILNPDIKSVLVSLKAAGYRLAVASSGPYKSVINTLEKNQILDYFEVVVSGQMFPKSKPDPEIYRYTVAQLGLVAADCLAVEDSIHGIRSARGAGIEVLALVNGQYDLDLSEATKQIQSITEVPLWLAK